MKMQFGPGRRMYGYGRSYREGRCTTASPKGQPRKPTLSGSMRNCRSIYGAFDMNGNLAEWVASARNPLTARVIVNRVWQHHFGRGLVATPNDFGAMGSPPTHPELLDWLASEFVQSGWRIKSLHRLIMSSGTYRMSSRSANADAQRIDPDNTLLWRQHLRRLEAEEIHDAMLVVAGTLLVFACRLLRRPKSPGCGGGRCGCAASPTLKSPTKDGSPPSP